MGSLLLTPLEEYLTHSYSPDCEYVDGRHRGAQCGRIFHSLLQALLAKYLGVERDRTGIPFLTLVEQRMRVREGFDNERRYRIPDVMVLGPGYRRTGVTLDPPVLTVEILSPDDTLKELVASRRSMSRSVSPFRLSRIRTRAASTWSRPRANRKSKIASLCSPSAKRT